MLVIIVLYELLYATEEFHPAVRFEGGVLLARSLFNCNVNCLS